MAPDQWRAFLERLSRDMLANEDAAADLPDDVVNSGWLGFAPAAEVAIAATEMRLGRSLPPSLRSFYAVTNGWRTVGCFIWDVLPVQELDWLPSREPHLYEMAKMAERAEGPFKDDLGDTRLDEYRFEQGTRVERSLVVTSRGDASTWLLDPDTLLGGGEWAGGRWSSWNPAMNWYTTDFAGLMEGEHATFLELTGD